MTFLVEELRTKEFHDSFPRSSFDIRGTRTFSIVSMLFSQLQRFAKYHVMLDA